MNTGTIIMIAAIIYFVVLPSFKDRVIPVKKLLIAPAMFMYMLDQAIHHNFNTAIQNNWLVIMGISIGIIAGILLRMNTEVKSDREQGLIWLPGTYVTLVTFLLIFSVHFIVGYFQSVNPLFLTQTSPGESILLFMMSLVSSLNIGSNGILFLKYLNDDASISRTIA